MEIVHITNESFAEEVLRSDVPVLADFYADWCGPCKMVAPILEEIAGERDDVKIVKINVDEAGDIAAEFAVMSIPTLILFKNGRQEKKAVGYQPKEALLQTFGL